jgi:hypothetical protein
VTTPRGGDWGTPIAPATPSSTRHWIWAALLGSATSFAFATATPASLHLTTPSGATVTWWRAGEAPTHWPAPGQLAAAIAWRSAHPGVEHGELTIGGAGEATALRLITLRIDPRQVQLSLQWGIDPATGRPAWDVDDAPAEALVALNAGMFVDALPWGWVVDRGGELLPPGRGPLSSAIIVRRDGTVTMVDGDDVEGWRAGGDVAAAFQTYPTLLTGDGVVPGALREGSDAVTTGRIDREHRDARLALGLDREGRLLIVLTRVDLALPGADRLPLGLTVPEMAAVMGSLGARQAALLDGGISAQLLLRDATGHASRWKGMRQVPLGLVARRR